MRRGECFAVQNLKMYVEECHSLKENFLRYALIMFFLESSTGKCRCKFLEAQNFPKLAVCLYVPLALQVKFPQNLFTQRSWSEFLIRVLFPTLPSHR
jgi:hypothetical protein